MKLAATLVTAMCAPLLHAQTATTATSATTVRATATQTDSADRQTAQYWGLALDDYRRYQSLMKGMRGAISDPRITPIEVLGIHARNDAERRKYAELFARLMAEDTERVLQFQLEYEQAFHRLFPKLAAVDFGSTAQRAHRTLTPGIAPPAAPATSEGPFAPAMSRAPLVSSGDRLLVFTRTECRDCEQLVHHALNLVGRGVTIDLYLVGARSPDDAQRFARRLALEPTLLSAGKVTLNLDGGTLARVLPYQPELPALVRKRGESLVQLAAKEL